MVAATMLEESAHPAVVEKLLQDALERSNVGASYRHDEHLLSDELQVALGETYRAIGGPRLLPDGLLVEKRIIGVKTGYPMFVFPNESKHPGNRERMVRFRLEFRTPRGVGKSAVSSADQLARKIGAVKRVGEEGPQHRDDAVHRRRRDAGFLLFDLEPPHILGDRGVGRSPHPSPLRPRLDR